MSTQKNILKLLEENRGTTFSGQDIANLLGISRNSVWKAVKQLQKNGIEIIAKSNVGYYIPENSNSLTIEGIRSHLSEHLNSIPIIFFDEIDSTNLEAKKNVYVQKNAPIVIIANSQTSGRGRLGRSFFSPKNTGIYLSIGVNPHMSLQKSFLLTTAAAVAVCRSIEAVSDVDAKIKWVNDVYINGKKVCGILTEGITSLENGELIWSVVGIGVNCFEPYSGFPEDIKETAAAISPENGCGSFNRNLLVAKIITYFFEFLQNINDANFIAEYKARSLIIGQKVQVLKNPLCTEGGIAAKAIDIDKNAALLVEYENGDREVLSSGEVSLKL